RVLPRARRRSAGGRHRSAGVRVRARGPPRRIARADRRPRAPPGRARATLPPAAQPAGVKTDTRKELRMTTETIHVPRSVAITGAGSGLGRAIAIGFADKGYRVFGTARTPEEVQDVRQATLGVAGLTVSDITDDAAVRGW